MSNFKTRERFSLETVRDISKRGNSISHVIDNQDGTYSVMSHINCEHCDYCDQSNDWWNKQKTLGLKYEEISKLDVPIFIAQEDPYKTQKVKHPENYGLINSYNPKNEITLVEVEKYWNKVIREVVTLEEFKQVLIEKKYNLMGVCSEREMQNRNT